jgi:hypothetical protein
MPSDKVLETGDTRFKMDKQAFLAVLKQNAQKKGDWDAFLNALWKEFTKKDCDPDNKAIKDMASQQFKDKAKQKDAILDWLSPKAHAKLNGIFNKLLKDALDGITDNRERADREEGVNKVKAAYTPKGMKSNRTAKVTKRWGKYDDIMGMLTLDDL